MMTIIVAVVGSTLINLMLNSYANIIADKVIKRLNEKEK